MVGRAQRDSENRGGDIVIESIVCTPVNLRMRAPYRWVGGWYEGSTKVVVEVRTQDGLGGLGEASNWRHATLIDEAIAPKLVGRTVDLRECWRAAVPPIQTISNTETSDFIRAYGAVEMALWDLRAKALDLPLYELLGGAARRRIPFAEYFSERRATGGEGGEATSQDIASYCLRMIQEFGSPYFEGKVGYHDLDLDIAIARDVREAIGPQRVLRLDANGGWTVPTAREALRRMQSLNIANIEDPVHDLESMARLRQFSPIPFSTHDPNLRAAIRLGVPDSFVLNLTVLGGIERTSRFIAACEAVGIAFTFYSGESGIGVAAYLHVGAADPHVSGPSQSLLRWYANDIVVGGPFQPIEGHLDVPNGPGLGVELDRAAVEKAHQDFLINGPLDQVAPATEDGYRYPPLY